MIPLALWPVLGGFAVWWVGVGLLALTLWLVWMAVEFRRHRSRPSARRLFFTTLAYLPLALVLVLAGARPV
jgi:heme O synthase-like polyprenyltransferase